MPGPVFCGIPAWPGSKVKPGPVFITRPGFKVKPGLAQPGSGDLRKSRFLFFVDVALRRASILENRVFLYSFNLMCIPKHYYLPGIEHWEYARTLSFEKCFRMHSIYWKQNIRVRRNP